MGRETEPLNQSLFFFPWCNLMLFGLPWNGCMVREAEPLVFLIMCSLQRESIFALLSLAGFTLNILISVLNRLVMVENTFLRTPLPLQTCDGEEHWFSSEGIRLCNFFCEASKFCPKSKWSPLHPLESHPTTWCLKPCQFSVSDSMTISSQFVSGPALSNSYSWCVFTPFRYTTASAPPLPLFPALNKLGTPISSDKNLIPLIVLGFSAFLKMLTRTVHAIPDKVLSGTCIRTNSLSLWKNCFGSISIEI